MKEIEKGVDQFYCFFPTQKNEQVEQAGTLGD